MIVPFDPVAVEDIAARLDLRDPNRRAVAAVADTLDSAEPGAEIVCDLATATGKTYIAAGVIDYLAAAGTRNVLIVCPGTTILSKTVANFTPGNAKFVAGLEVRPTVITPEDFARGAVSESLRSGDDFKLFVFNVQQLLRPTANTSRRVRDYDEHLGASLSREDGPMEIPPLPAATILLVEVGSTAHGTGLPDGEDEDELGVVIESAREVLGLDDRGFRTVMQRTQPEGVRSGPGDTDRTLHSLRRFIRLAASGNPSILMSFWAPVLHSTSLGEELRGLSPAFVGRHVVPRYRGYMESQALRLLGLRGGSHGRRGSGQREELVAAHGYDTKYAMHAARLGFQCIELLTTGRLSLPIVGEPATWLLDVRHGRIPFDEWWERCLDLDAQLGLLADDKDLAPGPDRDRIETWTAEAHQRHWSTAGA